MKARARTEAAPDTALDARMLWDAGANSLGFAENAYRAWFDGMSQMQAEAAQFLAGRADKDRAAFAEFARCTTMADALEMQARYVDVAFADYLAEGQRMLALAGEAANREVEAARVAR